jgi:hypothetical protein
MLRDAELFLTKLSNLDGAEKVGRLMETIAKSKRIVVVPKPVEKSVLKPVEKSAEKAAENPAENPAENSAEEVVENPAEEVTAGPSETQAEKTEQAAEDEETT